MNPPKSELESMLRYYAPVVREKTLPPIMRPHVKNKKVVMH